MKRILRHLPAAIRRRALSEAWIGDLAWPFPSWSVRRRVFDWAIDEADIPLDPEDHWHRGDRRRFDLYLRPAGVVARR